MPEDKATTDASIPAAPTGTAGIAAWYLTFFRTVTADRLLVLLLLSGMLWLGWTGREDMVEQRTEARDTVRDLRRENESREEKYRLHTLETIKLCNNSCAEQGKLRDARTEVHMKESLKTLNELKTELTSLRLSIDRLNNKTSAIP